MTGGNESRRGDLLCVQPETDISGAVLAMWNCAGNGL
jgi:hypothetical protein